MKLFAMSRAQDEEKSSGHFEKLNLRSTNNLLVGWATKEVFVWQVSCMMFSDVKVLYVLLHVA